MALYWGTPPNPLRLTDLTVSMSGSETNYPAQKYYLWGPFRRSKTMPSNGEDPFSKLPDELLHGVLMHLNSVDTRALKISSPVCDSIVLSSQFWRSRFWPGRDFPHYFDVDDKALSLEKWRNLWLVVRKLDGMRFMSDRKRVYKQSDKLRQLIMQRISAPVCCGMPVESFSEPEAAKPGREWIKASAKLCKPKDWFKASARALWKRDAPIPPSFTLIHVSWLIVNGKKYISGIRIGQDGAPETKLGYVRSSQETLIGWEGYSGHCGQEDVIGFDLAIDESGIRGLAVLSSSKGISKWVGDTLDIPKSRLLLTDNRTLQPPVKNIRAKFDVRHVCSTITRSLLILSWALRMLSLAINSGVDDVACSPK
ncbi:hypothetical protein NW762_012980 [Fusarium torreyae]|uniref:F-box domain-containing protein n=1 Tax=Fusarium torreyae TaxID=1237075 RepID=A0A9W8RQ00_9HYPO|nr:hypothetical protein NW762_012980 [Fusarium torreyae]